RVVPASRQRLHVRLPAVPPAGGEGDSLGPRPLLGLLVPGGVPLLGRAPGRGTDRRGADLLPRPHTRQEQARLARGGRRRAQSAPAVERAWTLASGGPSAPPARRGGCGRGVQRAALRRLRDPPAADRVGHALLLVLLLPRGAGGRAVP